MKIKRGDTVEVISGNDKGMRGSVHRVLPSKDKVIVSGINLVHKHQAPTRDYQSQSGIIEREAPIHISNVSLVCPLCDQPTRIGYDVAPDGTKSRVCRKCGEIID